ncbi:MAG: EF-P 5-aminopentanol modification-associated protein YfmH [Bacilli bacterium]|jgi:predicted Zn-dependent peptidase
MKKIIKELDEILYYEKLDNGLVVYMIPNQQVKNVYVTFTTKYGGVHTEFIPRNKDKMIKVPPGIAHFLEHKMFEQEDGIDPMTFYAERGTDVNAFTSLENTTYLFYGSTHLEENLNFLLDFVNSPYFTEGNVEKEKGIIEQEIIMFEDDPDSFLDDRIRLNTFLKHPFRFSVVGTIKDINEITKDNLYECYKTFYHPSNMFLVVTGNFNPEEVLNIVKLNQSKKEYPPFSKIKIKEYKEPNEVKVQYEERDLDIEVDKLAFAFKISLSKIKIKPYQRNIYLSLYFDILFSSTSSFYERMKKLNYIDSEINISTGYTANHLLTVLICRTKKAKFLIEEIKKEVKEVKIDQETFERKKRLLFSSKIFLFENIKLLNHSIINNVILYGGFDVNMIKLIKELKFEEFEDLISKIDFSNNSALVLNALNKQ